MSNFSREITVFSTSQREVDLHSSSEFFPSTYNVSSVRVGNVQHFSLAVDDSQSIISFQRTDSDDRDSHTPPDRNIYLSNIGSSSETQINDNNFSPIYPYIVKLGEGRYLNLWQSYNQDGSQSGIFGKITDASGREIISEFQVNENSFGDQYQFDVAVENNGDFVVAWSSYDGTDGPLQSHLRFFDVNATPASSEILITNEPNPSGIGVQQFQNPEVSYLSTGDVVVVSRGISRLDVKLVNSVSYEVSPIGKVDGGTQHDVAALEDGRFVIVWEEDERYSLAPGGETSQINGAILDSAGRIETPLLVNENAQYDHFSPDVLSLLDGGFMVSWVKQGLVEIQRFNSEGLALEQFSDYQINEVGDYGYATWAELDSVSSNTVRVSFLSGTSNGFGKHVKSTDIDVGFAGTTGNDFVSESEYFSFFALGIGDDTFVGQSQPALVFGDGGDDLLQGGSGDDALYGGSGIDTLSGGPGNDTLEGGPDADRFVIKPGDEQATILDFELGLDLLDLLGFDRADALDAFYNAQAGSAILTFGDGTLLTVEGDGVSPDTLSLSDVEFAAGNLPPEGTVVIEGNASEGQMLTADASGVSDGDGINASTLRLQWLRDGEAIADATERNYELTQADIGSAISVRYSYTDNFDTAESVTSAATEAVTNTNDALSGSVIINGTATQGETLTADVSGVSDGDGINDATRVFQWLRDGVAIAGAKAQSYVLEAADIGAAISVTYAYTDNFGTTESVTSAATAAVDEAGETITGTNDRDDITGTVGADTISALGSDDIVTGGGGNDQLDGGEGTDTAIYSGNQASYTVQLSASGVTVTDRRADMDGTDELIDFENLGFADRDFNLDIRTGAADLPAEDFAAIVELYIAYFNRAPASKGLLYWADRLEDDMPLPKIAESFFVQPETQNTYAEYLDENGKLNDTEAFVKAVFNNVLGRDPYGPYWINELDNNPAITPAIFILAVLNGAKAPTGGAEDREFLANKTDIGIYFSAIKGLSGYDDTIAVMNLFDGTDESVDAAVTAVDSIYEEALDPDTGEFLMPLVGVVDDPFAVA
ncbi:hypothetical protein [Marivita sp.]|uniref:hypothetical protein n=1 Tax=Marivita sp. TaxID=2003365 RepID=UPI003B5B003E